MKKNRVLFRIISTMLAICLLLSQNSFFSTASQEEAPSNPKNFYVSRVDRKNVRVEWKKVTDATGYELWYGTKSDFSNARIIDIHTPAKTHTAILAKHISNQKDTYLRMRSYKIVNGEKIYSSFSTKARLINWNRKWKYAKNSKIHTGHAVLYYAPAKKTKKYTVAINAGHGTTGGSSQKTKCHPDGSPKVTGGSTSAGSIYATSINEGTSIHGISEASLNLKIAKKLKAKLLSEGYNVLMIRQDKDVQLDNVARTVIANHYADIHLSIHYDSTQSDKGAFFISVPNIRSYRSMEPVKSNYRKHHTLGKSLIKGLKKARVKIYGTGRMALDLTQTSYSTIPSVDIEVGDRDSNTSDKSLNKIAKGLCQGVSYAYKKLK